ncbi:hypothetical protein EVAR_33893_1 [Eumeta japonica]|uniref:Uncharacterized protein n=1 Tax=Eumeta variegata TaxID=151549 RepID=A0A4C1WKX6_EUMVA|nr:hypothetical protein EVAR_33893_1 [Eumeta japonica]
MPKTRSKTAQRSSNGDTDQQQSSEGTTTEASSATTTTTTTTATTTTEGNTDRTTTTDTSTEKHSETPQAHTDEPVPVAPTDSADAPRPSEKRKYSSQQRLAALETEETDSEEDENTVVQDQETQRVGNWVDTQMETLATIDAPHQKTERRGKTAEYRRARDRCQDRHATCSLRDLDTSRVRNRTEETDRNPDSGARNRNLAYTTFST